MTGLVSSDAGLFAIGDKVLDDTEKGVRLPPEARGIGFVFQNHRLFPAMSVRENILFPQRFGGRTPLVPWEETVALLHLEELLDRRPSTLSGREAQRVSLARALCAAREMLILDEPTASLDPELRGERVEGVAAVARPTSIPILYITHMGEEALRLAPKALYVEKGRITNTTTPKPCSRATATSGRDSDDGHGSSFSHHAHAAGGLLEPRPHCGDRGAARAPTVRNAVLSAFLLGTARASGEVGITMMLGGNVSDKTNRLSLEIYNAVGRGDFDTATALCAVLAAVALVLYAALELLRRRSDV